MFSDRHCLSRVRWLRCLCDYTEMSQTLNAEQVVRKFTQMSRWHPPNDNGGVRLTGAGTTVLPLASAPDWAPVVRSNSCGCCPCKPQQLSGFDCSVSVICQSMGVTGICLDSLLDAALSALLTTAVSTFVLTEGARLAPYCTLPLHLLPTRRDVDSCVTPCTL